MAAIRGNELRLPINDSDGSVSTCSDQILTRSTHRDQVCLAFKLSPELHFIANRVPYANETILARISHTLFVKDKLDTRDRAITQSSACSDGEWKRAEDKHLSLFGRSRETVGIGVRIPHRSSRRSEEHTSELQSRLH